MSLDKRLDAIERAMAKRSGETDYKLAVRMEGETDAEAKERSGLDKWPGPILFMMESDFAL